MKMLTKKEKVILSVIIVLFSIFAAFVYTTPPEIKEDYQKALAKPVPTDSLRTMTPGDLFMDIDSVIFCVKNNTRTAMVIIASSAYGKKNMIFFGTPTDNKIIKIVKKGDQGYYKMAKKFLSTY